MDPRRRQILHWICTGEHVILADYTKPKEEGTALLTAADDAIEPDRDGSAPATSSTSSPLPDTLVGADNDLLILSSADIERVYYEGRATWTRFLQMADSLPAYAFPAGFGDPSIMLKDVPALLANLPKRGFISGRPLWYVPDPEPEADVGKLHLDLQYSYGV